ncbi:MAG TPA: replicative DNA helicase [Verrucomicrobiae bacterium]|nr:replicative DNA helicase [Verrucomicrobiae bacterium]
MIESASASAGKGTDFRRSRREQTLSERGAATLDRLPPHDLQMEMGVLGCIMLSPNECLGECVEKLKDDGKEAFYDLRHQTIYETLSTMFNARHPIDLITIQQNLKERQLLEQIGGIAYLSQIQDGVPSAANLSWYLEKVKEKYLLRRMIQTCTGVVGRIYEYEGEVDQLLDEVEKEVLRVNESRVQTNVQGVKDLVNHAIGTIEHFFNRKGELGGLPTGFPDLDRMTDGLHGGEMIVIAARPSMGKTSLAMNIAEHVVIEAKVPVGVFSLEMSAESLVLRMMCSVARVNLRQIRDGFMSEADFPKLMTAAGKLSNSKLFIDATAGLSILQLRARARRMAQQHGIKLFIIDYLQLLHSTARRSQENRQQEIAEISGGIKALAKELNVPVIVLAQLNRDIEKEKNRKPRMSDLRESGSIEQDADLVGLLYKPDSGDDEEAASTADESAGIPVNLVIAKQRNGPTGDVNLTFLKPYTRFESAAKFSNEDVPDGR